MGTSEVGIAYERLRAGPIEKEGEHVLCKESTYHEVISRYLHQVDTEEVIKHQDETVLKGVDSSDDSICRLSIQYLSFWLLEKRPSISSAAFLSCGAKKSLDREMGARVLIMVIIIMKWIPWLSFPPMRISARLMTGAGPFECLGICGGATERKAPFFYPSIENESHYLKGGAPCASH